MSGSPVKFAARRLVQEAMAASLDSEKLKKMAEAQKIALRQAYF